MGVQNFNSFLKYPKIEHFGPQTLYSWEQQFGQATGTIASPTPCDDVNCVVVYNRVVVPSLT